MTKRIPYQDLKRQSAELEAHVRMARIMHATTQPCRRAVVAALMVTSRPDLMKVHPAYAALGVVEKRRKLCSIPFTYSSGYDKDTDTFATADTATAVKLVLRDQVLVCTRCRGTAEYEGEYGPQPCMGCLVEETEWTDGLGNRLDLKEGDTLHWFSDMTFTATCSV